MSDVLGIESRPLPPALSLEIDEWFETFPMNHLQMDAIRFFFDVRMDTICSFAFGLLAFGCLWKEFTCGLFAVRYYALVNFRFRVNSDNFVVLGGLFHV